ncbi:MAG: hypothetical protein R6U27_01130 [Desulfobacterales bacterium]
MGHKELSSSLMEYRKAGLALIEQGISDTLCSEYTNENRPLIEVT